MGSKKIASIPLLIVGLFVFYIGARDDALFDLVRSVIGTERLGITIATTIAATVPVFFAVGMIRKSIGINWFTIYQYERMLEGNVFWSLAIIVLIIIAILHLLIVIPLFFAGIDYYQEAFTVIGCIISAIYLAKYKSKRNKKSYEPETY